MERVLNLEYARNRELEEYQEDLSRLAQEYENYHKESQDGTCH